MPKVPQMKLEMAGTIHGGGTGLIAARFGDTFAVKGDKSENELRFFFNNPCNGTGSCVMGFTYVRVICQNTLRAATKEAGADGWKFKHSSSAPEIAMNAVQVIGQQAIAAIEMKNRCSRLASIGVDSSFMREALDAVYPLPNAPTDSIIYKHIANLRDKVVEEFEAGETAQSFTNDSAWKLLNSFTFPIFNPTKLKKTTDKAQVAYSGWNGHVADKVERIFDKIEDISYRIA